MWLFGPVNEDTEEALWRRTVTALPEGPGCLAVLGYGDQPPAGKTPRHHPTYLLDEYAPGWTSHSLRELPSLSRTCKGPVYVLLGMRCYARLRGMDDAPPPGNEPLGACADILALGHLETVFSEEAANFGDCGLPLYPAGTPLRTGLYRIGRE